MNGSSSAGLRKAALMLSSLGDEDRAWLLARVGEDSRARLDPLVSEVRSLGVQLDAETVRQLVQSPPAPPAAVVQRRPIDTASAQAVHAVLAAEPDWLIALVLREGRWPWREALLRLLGTERRLDVQRARPQGARVRPRVLEALLSTIESRLEEHEAEPAGEERAPAAYAAAARNGAVRKLWTEVLQWRR